jgi:hypothetical protein
MTKDARYGTTIFRATCRNTPKVYVIINGKAVSVHTLKAYGGSSIVPLILTDCNTLRMCGEPRPQLLYPPRGEMVDWSRGYGATTPSHLGL